jgi:hypothetical protein
MSVKRPARFLEPLLGTHRQLNREKLKVDSDKVLAVALKEPLLKNLKIKATQLWLQREAWSGDDLPVWKVRLWAGKLQRPDREVEIGDVFISPETGKVIKSDLHIDRVE